MISSYSLPHICEREEVAKALQTLSSQKRRVLRAYVWEVELGEKDVTEWLETDTCPVSRTAWYRNGQANYLRNANFQRALEVYLSGALTWQMGEDAKVVAQAQHEIRRNALVAAQQLITLVSDAEKPEVRLRAAESVLNRAGVETAPKQEIVQKAKGYVGISPDDWDDEDE